MGQTKEQIPSLYIHVPFCRKKCNYCDFVSYAGKENLIGRYIEALGREITTSPLSPDIRRDSFPSPSKMERGGTNKVSDGVRTIYFGGGTPTLLTREHFHKIINTLICHLSLDICHSETSVEANPGTADYQKIKALRELGINRLSIGAQSFNNQHLQTLGRIHTAKDIFSIYENARKAGFENINLDLMFALPNQTLDEWKKDLAHALALGPEHISTYNLQIEEGTPLWSRINPHPLSPSPKGRGGTKGGEGSILPSEEAEAQMYEYAIETLTAAGYKHYEISNFARPGFACRHNINYWKNGNYIGIGAGAHSHVNGKRWANPNCIEEYLRSDWSTNRSYGGETTDQHEIIFLGLRLLDGISSDHFQGFEKEVNELLEDNLLIKQNGHYKLTRRGLFLANLVFEKFI